MNSEVFHFYWIIAFWNEKVHMVLYFAIIVGDFCIF